METQSRDDRVADEYVQRIFGELRDKPLNCQLLDQLADEVSFEQVGMLPLLA